MKLIEAMKQVKSLLVKADDIRKKIAQHSAILSIETPVYEAQEKQVAEWLQSHESIMQEIGSLQVRIAKTNLATQVTIKLGEKNVVKCVTEWIARRGNGEKKHGLSSLDHAAWSGLTDRGLREQMVKPTPESAVTQVTIKRFYKPEERDSKIEVYRSEPSLIDATLEVTNAVTDLLD